MSIRGARARGKRKLAAIYTKAWGVQYANGNLSAVAFETEGDVIAYLRDLLKPFDELGRPP
ncbi:MAG TPA: hypothetical protein VKM54_06835 [Myxococcota bacterium]|nr:hypothetical protein [Myxococcota bacterium]